MKAGLVAVAASSILGSSVGAAHHGHHHKRGGSIPKPAYFDYACCKTVVTETVYATMPAKPIGTAYSAESLSSSSSSSTSSASISYTTASPVEAIPTPIVTICPTPGTYEFSATTVIVNSTITVVGVKATSLTPGPNTFGGYTTTVEGPTTVTCPYVASSTSGTVVTSFVSETTYVCPSAGTYTPVAPVSTALNTTSVMVYPIPTTYAPGTYTAPATTVTAIETDFVYVCPFEAVTWSSSIDVSPTPAPVESTTSSEASSTAAPVSEAPASSSEAPAPVAESPSSVAPAYTAPASSAAAPVYTVPASSSAAPVYTAPASSSEAPAYSAPASSSAASTPVPSSGAKVNGNKWAMTYTPYTSAGTCKTADEVDDDMLIIKTSGFTTVRLYATDCSGLVNVGTSCKSHGLKIIVGVFINTNGVEGATPQVDEVAQWGSSGNWDLVTMIVVGNEAIFNNYCTGSELAAFITSAKSSFTGAGFSGPVTTTEPLGTLGENADALCGVIDVVAANIQPFFNGEVIAAEAGTFVKDQIAIIADTCPGKEAYNLECGWPMEGSPNGPSMPGVAEQVAAIADIVAKAGDKSAIFSFDNDAWKAPGEWGVEQFFGCSDLF